MAVDDLIALTDADWREQSRELPDSYGGYWPGDDGYLRVGIGRSRDSDALEESNYRTALKRLQEIADENGIESVTAMQPPSFLREPVEVESEPVYEHRASHWAVGWVESLWVADHPVMRDAVRDMWAALASYPVLDESDWSDLEQEQREEVYSMVQSDAFGWEARRADLEHLADEYDSDEQSAIMYAAVDWLERDWSPSPDDYPTGDLTARVHALLRGGRTDVEVAD